MLTHYELIPNGSDLEPLPPREGGGPLVIGMLAHHSEAKGTHLLIEALAAARRLPLRVRIHGTGEPGYLAAVRERASADERISFEGPFAPSNVANILAGLDLLVVPSIYPENCPLVVQDAMAAGRPCIVPSDSGATESIVDGRHGFHFARGSAGSLAEALEKLSENRHTPARLRENILSDRPVISRVDVAGRYLALYNELTAGRSGTS